MPLAPTLHDSNMIPITRMVFEEIVRYSDPKVQEGIVDGNLTLMNSDQRNIFDTIMSCQETKSLDYHEVFFICGPRGIGKTFLYNTLLAKTRSQGRIGLDW